MTTICAPKSKYRTAYTVDGVAVQCRTVKRGGGEYEIRKCVGDGWNVYAVMGGVPMFWAHYATEAECENKIKGVGK